MKLRVLTLLTAGLFGALGAALRVFTENDLLSDFSSEAALILINVVGSACLGSITVYCEERPASCLNFLLNKGIGTGLLGSFTTFSALSLLCLNHDFVSGTCYMALSITLGATAALGRNAALKAAAAELLPLNQPGPPSQENDSAKEDSVPAERGEIMFGNVVQKPADHGQCREKRHNKTDANRRQTLRG